MPVIFSNSEQSPTLGFLVTGPPGIKAILPLLRSQLTPLTLITNTSVILTRFYGFQRLNLIGREKVHVVLMVPISSLLWPHYTLTFFFLVKKSSE